MGRTTGTPAAAAKGKTEGETAPRGAGAAGSGGSAAAGPAPRPARKAGAVPADAARERLLKGALALFNRKGYASASVREIVAAASVTKPVLYYYFRSKEGIYLELMRGAAQRFVAIVDRTRAGEGGAVPRLLRLANGVYGLFVDRIEVARLMYAIYYGPPQGAPFFDFDAYHVRFQSAVRELVGEGIRSGEFRKGNGEDMTWAVVGVVNVALELELCHPEKSLGRTGLARVLSLVLSGFGGQGAEENGRTGPRQGTPRGGRR